ncbi:MAG TPA: carboxypeptidase regulatory-like domain-containing protein [Bryobacteraceae bacterium]|nr:carboxypeptidase regulatory-like domain-containing protein [Bryobacteraceae bacterium]
MERLAPISRFSATSGVLLLFTGALAWFICPRVVAQESRGTIVGQILDASGGSVPGATVTVTNVATNAKMETKSNSTGQYVIPFLIPGVYNLTAGNTGFKTSVRDGVELRISERLQVDFALEVGEVINQVQVTGETPLLQTANANLGQVMDTRRIEELPVPHGSPLSLIYLSPGVLDTYRAGNMRQTPDALQVILSSGVTINGSKGGTADFTMDGVPNTQTGFGGTNMLNTPPVDAVQEFKVETAFDASQGHTSGVIMNFALKSGTNQLHGTGYVFSRRPSWNANDFFSNLDGQPRSDFTYKRWGLSASGPVFIPKLYNGKSRTFFLYAYENYDAGSPDPFIGTVPTAADAGGDFSSLLALGSQYQIYDPATIKPAGAGRFSIQPFPGNIIPTNRISPIATNILKHYPAPNSAGLPDGENNFSNQDYMSPELYYVHVGRVDHYITENQRVFVRVSQNQNLQGPYRKRWNDPAVGQNALYIGRQIALDYVYTINPSLIANIRYGFSRFNGGSHPDRLGFDMSQLGFSSQVTNLIDPAWMAFPTVSVSGMAALGSEGASSTIDNDHALFASVTKEHGRHSMSFGADLRAYRKNVFNPGNAAGSYTFGTAYTQGPFDNSTSSPGGIGQGLAALLLGLPTQGSIDRNDSQASQSTYWALYFQDNWRVSRNLTLNMGLRWEYEGPTTERYNRSVRGFDPNAVQPIEGQAKAKYALSPDPALPLDQFQLRGGLLFAGVGGQPSYLWDRSFKTFAPRFGFAYQAARSIVVRGGFGIFPIEIGVPAANNAIQTGYSQTTALVPTLDNGQTFIGTLSNPFPSGVLAPAGSSQGIQTFLGRGISFYDSNAKTPYAMHWSLNIQTLLPGQVLLETGYVGSKSVKLQMSRNYDALPDRYLSTSPVRDQATIDYLSQNIPNPMAGLLPGTSLNGSTIPRASLLVPFPQFTSVTALDYQGYSWYHGLQVRAERRFQNGFTVQVGYSFSKTMEATSYLNAADPLPYRAISFYDRPHQLTFSGIFEFPIGRGKRLLGQVNRVANAFVGGWQIAPIWQLRSGWPYQFGNVLFTGNIKDIPLPSSQETVWRYFNTEAGFERDPTKQLASNLRTFPVMLSGVRTAGSNLVDLSLLKKTRIMEGHEIEFRADFFNLFNHPTEPTDPNTSPTSSAFGQMTQFGALPRNIQLGIKYVF